jgi:hypothetical protein
MFEEVTTEYNIQNWKEATKDWTFTSYVEGFGELIGTICISDTTVCGGFFKPSIQRTCKDQLM